MISDSSNLKYSLLAERLYLGCIVIHGIYIEREREREKVALSPLLTAPFPHPIAVQAAHKGLNNYFS